MVVYYLKYWEGFWAHPAAHKCGTHNFEIGIGESQEIAYTHGDVSVPRLSRIKKECGRHGVG